MGPQTLRYGDATVIYDVSKRSGIDGKVSIHVHPDGKVVVDAPEGACPDEVRAAVRKRARWLVGHVEKVRDRQRDLQPRKYVSGESHFYLGRRYLLKILSMTSADRQAGTKPGVKLIRGQLQVITISRDSNVVKKLLRDWYREHARKLFERRLQELASSTPWIRGQLPPVKLLTMKKHWGSCSPSGSIVLNPHLVKAPRNCTDYVILHELCHLKEHNHSPQFWRLMDRVMPSWRKLKQELDDRAEILLNA